MINSARFVEQIMNFRALTLACLATFALSFPVLATAKKKAASPPQSQPTAVTPVTLTKDTFTFQYPSNWNRNDEKKSPHDPVDTIILDCPQNSYLKLFIVEGLNINVEEKLNDILQSYITAITPYTQKDIRKWGSLYGRGIQIEGKVMDAFPGGIRIFVSDAMNGKHLIITEFYYAEDIEAYINGTEMIQKTLTNTS